MERRGCLGAAAPLTCTLPGPLSTARGEVVLDSSSKASGESAEGATTSCHPPESKSGASSSVAQAVGTLEAAQQPCRHPHPGWTSPPRIASPARPASPPRRSLPARNRRHVCRPANVTPSPRLRRQKKNPACRRHRPQRCTSRLPTSPAATVTSSTPSADCSPPRPPMRRPPMSQARAASC